MFDEVIQRLEAALHAIDAKDHNRALGELVYIRVEVWRLFGHSPKHFADFRAVLDDLKDHLEAKEFDEASTITIALLAKLRAVREASIQMNLR
jgi:hypothetical protein